MLQPASPVSIAWPAIIHYTGQDELAFVADQAHWDHDPAWHRFQYRETDQLIDADGRICRLRNANGIALPVPTGRYASLHEIIDLVRMHAARTGDCCISKYFAPSIKEAILAVPAFD